MEMTKESMMLIEHVRENAKKKEESADLSLKISGSSFSAGSASGDDWNEAARDLLC